MGGLGICKPEASCIDAHENSKRLSAPLVKLIMRQELDLDPSEIASDVQLLRRQIDEDTEKLQKLKLEVLLARVPLELQATMKMTIEKGASSWVTATTLYDHGTVLHKPTSSMRFICDTAGLYPTFQPNLNVMQAIVSSMLLTAH